MSNKAGLIKVSGSEEEALVRTTHLTPASNIDRYGHQYAYDADDDASNQVRDIWRRITKHKFLIMLIPAIVTILVAIEVFREKNIYSSTATVEVGKENRTLFRSGDVSIEGEEDDYAYRAAMKTKIKLLQTRPLLEDVVVVLKLDQNPEFIAVTERRSTWESIRSIGTIFNRDTKRPVVETPEVPDAPRGGPLLRPTAESARLAPFVDILHSNLSAEVIEDTQMLAINYKHSNPALAAAIANAAAQVFIERSYRGKATASSDTSNLLNARTRELQAKVEQAEEALATYANAHNIFSSEGKESLTSDRLATMNEQVMKIETDRILKQSLYEEVRAGRLDQLPESFADPKIIALQTRLGELTTQMAQMRVKLGAEHPKIVELNKQISAIQKQVDEGRKTLADRLKADYERVARDEQSLKQLLSKAKLAAAQQNHDSTRYSILKQDVETAKQLYTDFLQKTNQANVQVASQQKNMQLIEPAQIPRSPVGPNRMRTITIGLLLSLVASVGLALFIEFLNNTFKSVEDVARYLRLPTLALVPALNKKNQRELDPYAGENKDSGLALESRQNAASRAGGAAMQLSLVNSRSTMAEAYRALRTSLLLSGAGEPPRTILVTSSQPGEGKSTTSLNLAIALAQLKAPTLVIDADMRRPTLHKVFGLSHANGLSTYLSNEVELDGLIKQLDIPNLYFMPSGMIPPDPAELVSTDKMKTLLGTLSKRFRYVVIDSPPLINISDAVIISTIVDGVVFVVKGGDTKRNIVTRARQELANVGARVFGVVINNINLKSTGYDDYYYQRYHTEYKQDSIEMDVAS